MKLLDKLLTLFILVMGMVLLIAVVGKAGFYPALIAWLGGLMFATGLSEYLRS